MNPVNVLRELRKMHAPPADDRDRRRVAEETLEVLADQPILQQVTKYAQPLADVTALIQDGLRAKGSGEDGKQEPALAKNTQLFLSFLAQLEEALHSHFLRDSIDWLSTELALDPQETPEAAHKKRTEIERVCRDLLSVALDSGFSLESLFQLYRHLAPASIPQPAPQAAPPNANDAPATEVQPANPATAPYVFMDRLERVRIQLVSDPRSFRAIFGIAGTSGAASQIKGTYANILVSDVPPQVAGLVGQRQQKFLAARPQWLWADATVQARDGRAAGMIAYRQIAQLLDLARFYHESRSVTITQDFLLEDGDERHLLSIPALIPNPESEQTTLNLEQFVTNLNGVAARDEAQAESRDRIFAAFRLYRLGTEAHVFENKLVNWWTGTEYLAKGAKASGSIGAAVEDAMAPTLALAYLAKHLGAYRRVFASLNVVVSVDGQQVIPAQLTDINLYQLFRRPDALAIFQAGASHHTYVWHYLAAFLGHMSTHKKISELLRAHERRLRWQIQRIYRARCDIVHSAQVVVNAALLCANLEFYLRTTLHSMLRSFQAIPTLRSPAEFFDRQKYFYGRVISELERPQQQATDNLLRTLI